MANKYWENKLTAGYMRPTETSGDEAVWEFVQEKYVKRSFAPKDELDPVKQYNKVKTENASKKVEAENQKVAFQQEKKEKQADAYKIGMMRGDKGTTELEIENSPLRTSSGESTEEIAEEKSKKKAASTTKAREHLSLAPREFAVGVNAFTYLNTISPEKDQQHHQVALLCPTSIDKKLC